jgi:hypothetical protein
MRTHLHCRSVACESARICSRDSLPGRGPLRRGAMRARSHSTLSMLIGVAGCWRIRQPDFTEPHLPGTRLRTGTLVARRGERRVPQGTPPREIEPFPLTPAVRINSESPSRQQGVSGLRSSHRCAFSRQRHLVQRPSGESPRGQRPRRNRDGTFPGECAARGTSFRPLRTPMRRQRRGCSSRSQTRSPGGRSPPLPVQLPRSGRSSPCAEDREDDAPARVRRRGEVAPLERVASGGMRGGNTPPDAPIEKSLSRSTLPPPPRAPRPF